MNILVPSDTETGIVKLEPTIYYSLKLSNVVPQVHLAEKAFV